ncbi:MAG: TonB-dependent receptor [Bacteroidales bacterium]
MKLVIALILLSSSLLSVAQSSIDGIVKDKNDEPIFAANVYLKSSHQKGVTTNFEGRFNLYADDMNDTLIVSFIGYETRNIPLSDVDTSKVLEVVLFKKNKTLQEVIITANDPISEKFSVEKIEKMDVFLNPVSKGDPLKFITILPASTTTNETANPSLRGSSPNRSRVVLNGVPVYKPVRASQLNNQGFFSLFNNEIINKQYVYASNPPLTYGNTSAGLVEIQTIKNLESNQLQLSASLASTGFFLSQNIEKDTSFIQVYGNFQFSDAFLNIQKENLPDIKNFYTKDAGINFHRKIGERCEFNSYSYYIDESFNGYDQSFTYKGSVSTLNKRIFTVNNFRYSSEKGILSVNSGTNNTNQHFDFGNIHSEQQVSQVYSSIDYKWHLLENTRLQFGASHDYHSNKFNDSIPSFYYALSPGSPNYFSETSIYNHILEAYLYTNWNINDNFSFSSGMRSNLPVENQKYYLSSQAGLQYRLNQKHSFLLSGGKYHNYSTPNYYSKSFNLLSSSQIALDYTYELKYTLLKAAAYLKEETGNQTVNVFFKTEKINTFGLEIYLEHEFFKYFKFSFSNLLIDQKMTIYNKDYPGPKDFRYFLKSTIQYNNPKLISLALSYTNRPGVFYNEISEGTSDPETNFYEPVFSDDLYSTQYNNYKRLDINLSKYIRMQKNAIIAYVSLNNVLNNKNEKSALYNSDYSDKYFNYYQFRTIYFGLVWQFNY